MNLEPHLKLVNICKTFKSERERLVALDGVSLDVCHGEFVSILGPSGCGKSTLLRIVGGLLQPTAGQVFIDGSSSKAAQEEKSLGFVFQEPSLLAWCTVKGNVQLPLQVNRHREKRFAHATDDLIDLVGLTQFSEYYPFQLSGGMQQRVALARSLVFDPSVLLMDEPLGALDEITRAEMRYELLRIWELDKKTVLMVTHSIAEAVILSDRVVVLSGLPGRIKGIVTVDLPRPRTETIERSQEFLHYTDTIHTMLRGTY